jgi:hypothetical protein
MEKLRNPRTRFNFILSGEHTPTPYTPLSKRARFYNKIRLWFRMTNLGIFLKSGFEALQIAIGSLIIGIICLLLVELIVTIIR